MTETISKLDLSWEAVNALGGSAETKDVREQSYNDAIGDALMEIEKLGGKDPAAARANGAVEVGDGGPAFPQTSIINKDRNVIGELIEPYTATIGGMSLRDWLAGQAMPVLLDAVRKIETGGGVLAAPWNTLVAKMAYEAADAMLAERAIK